MTSAAPPASANLSRSPLPRPDPGRSNHTAMLLRAHGYVILEDLASAPVIERVCAELEPWFSATPRCQGNFYGWKTTRLGSILLKSPACQELVLHPTILDLAHTILAPHCDWYQLNLTQAVRIHPGERQQAPHRDEEMWPCQKNGVEYLINVLWALSDFTADNGATLLWPGSQFNPPQRQLDPADATVAEMPRGSALVYLGSITHCAGANRSTVDRTGLILATAWVGSNSTRMPFSPIRPMSRATCLSRYETCSAIGFTDRILAATKVRIPPCYSIPTRTPLRPPTQFRPASRRSYATSMETTHSA